MKAQILKIAGVKSEKEFYKKYPSEEAFMKKHGKEFKKAQTGAAITAAQVHQPAYKPLSYQTQFDEADKMITGSTATERQAALAKQQAAAPQGGGSGFDIAGLMKLAGGAMGGEGMGAMGGAGAGASGVGASSIASAARYGAGIHRAQFGGNYNLGKSPDFSMNANQGFSPKQNSFSMQTPKFNAYDPQGDQAGTKMAKNIFEGAHSLPNAPEENTWSKVGGALGKYAGPVGDIISGIGDLQKEKEARKAAEQARDVSKISLKAAESVDVDARRQQSENISKQREAQMPVNTGEEFFPIYGVGTNVLARNGAMLQDGDYITTKEDVEPVMEVGPVFGPQNEEYNDLEQITDYSDPNEMTDAQSAAFMETYNRDQGKSTETFDSSSARDTWVHKTGLPWSEAKRLGYTGGSAKENTKLLAELNDPRFKKENLRDSAPKNSKQSRTPIQHRETPTGKLTPITKPLQSYAEATKGLPKYDVNQGSIHTPDEGNMVTRIGERVANPIQTFGHYAQYGELPAEGFSKHSKNAFDQVLGLRNPAYWANAIGNASDYASEGEYKKAAWEALDAAPALGKIKYVKNIPFPKGLPPASVRRAGYLGEGAKRLGAAPARQLTGKAAKQIAPSFVPNFTMRKDGGPVEGNPTEIQNTYGEGNSLYDDLGYVPIVDPNQQKDFRYGGHLQALQDGGAADPWGAVSHQATGMGQSLMGGQNAGGKIGGTAGKAIGNAIVPGVGGAVGEFVGGIAGNLLDTNARKMKKAQTVTERNMQGMANANMAKGIQAQNQSYMEDGGWVSHDWQPQVIASFGDHSAKDVYNFAHEGMDTLRTGGNVRQNNMYQTDQYALGGEVQTTWGGGAETLSHNPYMPGSGETLMFRGNSHEESDGNGHTGIGVKYGQGSQDSYTDYAEYGTQDADANVEVERGEPAAELEDENGEKNLTVYGNLQIPNQFLHLLDDPTAKGKKFKNYVAGLSKIETKQNTIIEKASKELSNLDPVNSFDKLKLTALQASIQGANMKLKDIADKKINAASLQNSINDTAEEHGLVADDLAKGKAVVDKKAMKEQAKYGKQLFKAQDGVYKIKGNLPGSIDYNALGQTPRQDLWKDENTYENVWKPKVYSAFSDPRRAEELVKNLESYKGQDFEDVQAAIKKGKTPEEKKAIAIRLATDKKIGPFHAIMDTVINQALPAVTETKTTTPVTTTPATKQKTAVEEIPEKENWWDKASNIANAILPSIRPSDAEGLDAAQLYPEMFAMANNQVVPVQAQTFQPNLNVPYDISFQDQLNANQADYRAAQRTMGYNPAAQANLNAQKYQANQSVLGNQFRANQEMKDKVYGENRNILNDAKLKNLDIFDKQYGRQTEALANTKATTQAALNSIADKYAKNKLEGRELKTYENMYNYRFGPNFRAQNMNPLAQFDTEFKGASTEELDAISAYKKALAKREATETAKKGKPSLATESITKRNGAIVKALKNI